MTDPINNAADPITARLDRVKALADKATLGPWEACGNTVFAQTGPGDCGGCSGILSPAHEPSCYWTEVAGAGHDDAVLIAAMRTDVVWMEAVIRAVMEVHRRLDPPEEDYAMCAVCHNEVLDPAPWPCATVRAVQDAMGGDHVDE